MQSSISLKQETESQPVAPPDEFTVTSAMAITQSHPYSHTHLVALIELIEILTEKHLERLR